MDTAQGVEEVSLDYISYVLIGVAVFWVGGLILFWAREIWHGQQNWKILKYADGHFEVWQRHFSTWQYIGRHNTQQEAEDYIAEVKRSREIVWRGYR